MNDGSEVPMDLPAGVASALTTAAASNIRLPSVWGGENFEGPTGGGFDCSGLVLHAVYQASTGDSSFDGEGALEAMTWGVNWAG